MSSSDDVHEVMADAEELSDEELLERLATLGEEYETAAHARRALDAQEGSS